MNKLKLWKKKWLSWKSPTKIQILIGVLGTIITAVAVLLIFTDIPENLKFSFFKKEPYKSPIINDFKPLANEINRLYTDTTNVIGCNHILVISLNPIFENRRKYIFDNGYDLLSNRISLFLDESNNLVYSVIDSNMKEYNLTIYKNKLDSVFYYPVSIACEVISNKYIWKQAIYINDIEFEKNIYNYPIQFDFKKISGHCEQIDSCENFKLGYNLDMRFPASFDAFLITQSKTPFTSVERRKLHNIFKWFLNKLADDTMHFPSYTGDGRRIWR